VTSITKEGGQRELAKTKQLAPGAMVVLFNPSEAHIQNLLHLKSLCGDVVAVDNSPALDRQLHKRIQSEGVDILANFNRGGVAGAYNKGIERLLEKKSQMLFIFDQDSQIPEDYFVQMLDAGLKLDSEYFLIGPKVFDINVNRYLPAHVIQRFAAKPVPITDQNCGLLPCSSLITSGTAMSVETYRVLGPFMEDYFIDQVDTEYCFRAVCKGIPIYVNTSLTLKHEVSKRIDHKILFFKLTQWNMGPLRQYYSARNCIHIVRRYGAQFPIVSLINILTMGQMISILFFEEDKHKKMVAMMAGIIDGLRGRGGSFENCRSRTYTFCMKQSH
jgi:GT2 family glycosyltransferase